MLKQKHLDYMGITEFHNQGYKGGGKGAFLNLESSSHGDNVVDAFLEVAPDCKVLKGTLMTIVQGSEVVGDIRINVNGDYYDLVEYIKDNDIKIINSSTSPASEPTNMWMREHVVDALGVILICAAGNEGLDRDKDEDGVIESTVVGRWKYTGISVGRVSLQSDGSLDRTSYSSCGEELDFVTLSSIGMAGTSFSAPTFAGMVKLVLDKYGDMNQYEMYKFLQTCSVDLLEQGFDIETGFGIPILTNLEEVKPMNFKDVKEDRWSFLDISKCVDLGILKGFEDGTFRPAEPVTREQLATVIVRLIEVLK